MDRHRFLAACAGYACAVARSRQAGVATMSHAPRFRHSNRRATELADPQAAATNRSSLWCSCAPRNKTALLHSAPLRISHLAFVRHVRAAERVVVVLCKTTPIGPATREELCPVLLLRAQGRSPSTFSVPASDLTIFSTLTAHPFRTRALQVDLNLSLFLLVNHNGSGSTGPLHFPNPCSEESQIVNRRKQQWREFVSAAITLPAGHNIEFSSDSTGNMSGLDL